MDNSSKVTKSTDKQKEELLNASYRIVFAIRKRGRYSMTQLQRVRCVQSEG